MEKISVDQHVRDAHGYGYEEGPTSPGIHHRFVARPPSHWCSYAATRQSRDHRLMRNGFHKSFVAEAAISEEISSAQVHAS
jgi:hypothetical protein